MRKSNSLSISFLAAFLVCVSCGEPPATNNAQAKSATDANKSAAASSVNTAAIDDEIKKAMDSMAAALTANDAAAMEKMLTDNYRFVSTDGSVSTREERIALMK